MAKLMIKALWAIWVVLLVYITAGTIIYKTSSKGVSLPLVLEEHETVDVDIVRLLSHRLNATLVFSVQDREPRAELGSWDKDKDWAKKGFIKFGDPGEPVRLLIEGSWGSTVFEALPSSGYGGPSQTRKMVPFHEDGDDTVFSWPPSESLDLWGKQTLKITVLDVGDSLKGERVCFGIRPPITLKFIATNYSWLRWFRLWPFFYAALLKYAVVILMVKSWVYGKSCLQ